jgi:Ser/Thr protein kinase RdoA (MazF antagonist)
MTTTDAIAVLGGRLTVVAPLDGGAVSHASVVADAAGDRWVLKWWAQEGGENDSRAWVERAAERVGLLRSRGYPAPRYVSIAERDGLLAVLQELLPGRPPVPLRRAHVRALVALNELQAETQEDDGSWAGYLIGTLLHGADGYCLHEPMRRHSAASAALLDRVVAIGGETDPASLPGRDLAHSDFHHLNVLADGDRISGIVDCEGVRPGDRAFDLVTLLFCSAEGGLPEPEQEQLWRALCGVRDAPALRAYLAHMALRMASWSVVHHGDAEAARWIRRGGRWLDRQASPAGTS